MKLLSNLYDSLNAPAVNEVGHDINSDHIDAHGMQPDSYSSPSCKTHSNLEPMPKTSVLMPSNVQIHRQVPLNNAESSKDTKTTLYKLLQKYDTIISYNDNDIGQTEFIKCI